LERDLLEKPSVLTRISNAYKHFIQNCCYSLFRKGKIAGAFIVASIFGEPCQVISNIFRSIFGWKNSWKRKGFYDASSVESLYNLKQNLSTSKPNLLPPVLLLHGYASSPTLWLRWSEELKKARDAGKVGHVFTLQLPNMLDERMEVVRKSFQNISEAYKSVGVEPQINLIGHSLGGYTAHLAAYNPEGIKLKDKADVERRWHSIDPMHLNSQIGKIISIGAPTWLCCEGQGYFSFISTSPPKLSKSAQTPISA
jgi:pimeloyl-ACP methyl ester carboxylesterase